MRKGLLRSVLVAAFSAVMAFGVVSAHSAARSDAPADSFWGGAAVESVDATLLADSIWPVAPQDSDETAQA